ncbi:MAG: group III truncated hemoglobin [Cyclobacteriaceae bacterium]|nr:group III truncated hemoglobin [Cyclobacteriaceae bacterium]
MPNKRDIENRKDIELLVNTFYKKVLSDEVIAYIFTDVAKINFHEHMPKMYDFWESTLFQNLVYKGNPMTVHLNLNIMEPLKKQHFDRWLYLFNETVDELFAGEKAFLAKTRATSIATMMQTKIHQQNSISHP